MITESFPYFPISNIISHIAIGLLSISFLYYVGEYFPSLIHRKKRFDNIFLAEYIGHRGSRDEGLPENTIAAFRDAINKGAEVIELDVWLSKDQKVVVHHDDNFKRMTNGDHDGKIYETSYSDFPIIIPSGNQMNRSSSWIPRKEWQNIPLFEQVLEMIPSHISIIIEFKQDSDVLIHQVLALLQKYDRLTSVYWFSLIETINTKLRKANPHIPIITSVIGILRIILLYYTGLLPFCRISEDIFGMPLFEVTLKTIREEKALMKFPDFIKRMLAILLQGKPAYLLRVPRLFRHLRERGIPVWFLGVNTHEDLETSIKLGATAVLTDRIGWLKAHATAQGMKLQKLT